MSTSTINLGSLPVERGAYDGTANYYLLNEVTMFGMMFRAKTGTLETPLTGYAPAELNASGNAVLINTDKWELVAGTPDIYNEAQRLTSVESDIADVNEDIEELQELYEALTQSDIIVGALPDSGTANKIYRVPGERSYADYMWYDGEFVQMAEYDNAIDDEPTEDSDNVAKSGGIWSFVTGLINGIREWATGLFAKMDGWYSTMTVGRAENLVGQTVDSEAYLIRPTGGAENEVANGVASVLGMEGNSCVWNQCLPIPATASQSENGVTIVNNGNGSYTISTGQEGATSSTTFDIIQLNSENALPANHKLFIKGGLSDTVRIRCSVSIYDTGGGAIITPTESYEYWPRVIVVSGTVLTTPVTIWPIIIDLTLLGIDNLTTTAQVEAWLAQHVGTKPYYAYNAGTILSAQTLGVKTYGQNLLNPTTRQAKLIPYTWEENSNVYTLKNVPSGATATFTPDATGVAETVDISGGSLDITSYGSGILELSAATSDTYVCMKWDEQKDDDVVPFEEHTQEFDVRKVYGKVNGAGEYVQCFPNGMRGAGSVHDSLTASEAVVKTAKVDLSTRTIQTRYTGSVNKTISLNLPHSYNMSSVAILSQTYKYIGRVAGASVLSSPDNKEVGLYTYYDGTSGAEAILYVVLPVSSSLTSNDVIVYSRNTPITYTDLIYRDGGIDKPLADVLMNIIVNNWSMEEQLITPYENGNPTSIPATIKTQYGMDAVEAIDTLQKTSYFADDVHANLQALLTCINTNCAETLGGTFSVSDTATEKVFEFTFTPNTEPDVEQTNEGE